MIRIILDSAADRNAALEEAYNIEYIPLSVILDDKEYLDGVDISLKEVHDYMKAGNFPKTSQISPQTTIDTFEEAAKAGDDVIFISIFEKLSGTPQVARNAIKDVQERYPDFKGAVVDSRSAAGAENLLYLHGMELVEAGYDFDQIVNQLQTSAQDIAVYLAVDDLNWLAKGGRLPKTIAKFGSMLKVKPLLTLDETGIIREALVRGKDRVYTKMADTLIDQIDKYEGQYIMVSHVDRLEMAERVSDYIREKMGDVKIGIFEMPAVIASHVGIGGIGMFAYKKKPELFEPVTFN